ncbi:PREDICTED: probable purine permease 4 [Nelumbo nucifera]|uniref:Probable purine permease n=1 Tax=Nelumbo nucifera TaxID=4432 RepID=A0A1U8AFT8_NELNU|nr:PREDICTED: probable purine permease 4 [Nelumbo nucifera]
MEISSPASPQNPSLNSMNKLEREGKKEDIKQDQSTKSTDGSASIQFHQEKEKEMMQQSTKQKTGLRYWLLLLINYFSLFAGSISSSLLSRYYFIHGGSSRWVSTWVQSAGFPLLLLLIYLPRLFNCTYRRPFSLFTPKLLLLSVLIGLAMGLNNFLFSWGISYLSVSTSSLLLSSQLAFNLLLSVILVKQKLSFTNVNCVFLLTLSSILLALGSSHDRPEGVTKTHYFLGFFSILGAGLLFALYLPVIEMVYRKIHSYEMVMEMQVVMEIAATVLATVGMVSNGGYEDMRNESRLRFDLGPVGYWLTVGFNVVSWQMCFMGTAGLVFLTTSLTGGICMTALLPMNVVGGVLVYGDSFGGSKAVSTVLCLWGFCSYVYGEYVKMKREREELNQGMEMADSASDSV